MDGTFWLNFLMRWLHVASAAAVIGSLLLVRFAVIPALGTMSNGRELYAVLEPKFKKLLHSGLGLAVLTGFYNYGVVTVAAIKRLKETHTDLGLLSSYHAVMGVKMLLSFALFGLAVALMKPSDKLPENRKSSLSVTLVLGLLILAIGAYLRRVWAIPLP
ncbi:MAG: hypothetical protein ACO1SX_19185 [Actinomycetota bacterium]